MNSGFLTVLFLPVFAHATQPLSWNSCVDLAAKNNSELQAGLLKYQSTASLEGAARSGLFPTISGSLNYDRGNVQNNSIPSTTAPTTTTGTGSVSTNRYTATLSGNLNLFNGMQDLGKMSQASANSISAKATLDTLRAKISYDLKSAYQGMLYAREYEQFAQEIINRREANLQMVKLLFQSGRENKGSLLLSQAYFEQARYDGLQSHHAIKVAAAQLARVLGFDHDAEVDIREQIPVTDPAVKAPDLRELASETPDFRRAAADADSADAAVTVARSQFFPTLSASGSVGRQGAEFWPDDVNRWSVGVSLQFPLFTGGKDYYSARSATEAWKSAESTRLNVNRDLLAKLEQAYAAYVEAVAKLRVDQSFMLAANTRAEIARKRYNNGLMNFEDWDLVETDLINRRRTYLQSKRDRVVAEANWEQVRGKGVLP